MGQQESTPENSQIEDQEQNQQREINFEEESKNYEYEQSLNDPRFGEIKIMKHSTIQDKRFAVKQKYCTSKDEFQETVKQIEYLKYINHPNIVKVIEIRSEKDEGFCSQVFLVRIVFEWIDFDLKTDTLQRVSADNGEIVYYNEAEIVHMLQDTVSALQYLKQQGIYHGDLTSKNIFIGSDINNNKLHKLHIPYYTNQSNHYSQVQRQQDEELFLSPQLFEQLGQKELRPIFDQEKSDLFSLGIIGLQVCLLEETNSCYNFEDFSIKHDTVQAKLQQIADKYSEQLAETLISFLETDEENRASFDEAQELLMQHSMAKDVNAQIEQDYQLQSPETKKLLEESKMLSAMKEQLHTQENLQQDQDIQNIEVQERDMDKSQLQDQQNEQYQSNIPNQDEEEEQIIEQHKRAKHYQHNELQPSPKKEISLNDNQLNQQLKNIDQMLQEAINTGEATKQRYESNTQIRSFMKELLDDEIFVPVHPSPNRGQKSQVNNSNQKSNSKSLNRSFKPDDRWKI